MGCCANKQQNRNNYKNVGKEDNSADEDSNVNEDNNVNEDGHRYEDNNINVNKYSHRYQNNNVSEDSEDSDGYDRRKCDSCGSTDRVHFVSAGKFCWQCRYDHWSSVKFDRAVRYGYADDM